MSGRKLFSDMDAGTRRFYSDIINTAVLNIYAVEQNLFDTLLCESGDPAIMERWKEVEPLIRDTIQRRTDIDPGENPVWTDF